MSHAINNSARALYRPASIVLAILLATAAAAADRGRGFVTPEVEAARNLAAERLDTQPTCDKLFAVLGESGGELLAQATFRQATRTERERICRGRRAALFTTVGGSEIVVCEREFRRFSLKQRAASLLHELLHHAGVSEQPFDPRGLTSEELTRLVERLCRL